MTNESNVNVSTWFNYFSDPGFAVLCGFIALVLPFFLALFNPAGMAPIIHDAYIPFAGGVAALITAHAWKDADKTRYLMEADSTQNVSQNAGK
jgi:hypothetical protein